MSRPDAAAALRAVRSIPRDGEGPVFPAPWAARAFAIAVALNGRGVFAWSQWAEALGAELAKASDEDGSDPAGYWRAWLAALESILAQRGLAQKGELALLQQAWREAAERTAHGDPIELPPVRLKA